MNYRETLYKNYHRSHLSHLSNNNDSRLIWFLEYVKINYLDILLPFDKNAKILEIGCSQGHILSALNYYGFSNLYGVDLSTEDLEIAKSNVSTANIVNSDGYDFLENNKNEFDVILMKAVLEHTEKNMVMPFLEKIEEGLKFGGLVIIDIPNMDWFFSQHERYMDFTHEVGFTRESLAQVMRNIFQFVQVGKAKTVYPKTVKSKVVKTLRPFVISMMNKTVFKFIGEGGSESWWDARGIIGIGYREKKTK